MTVLAPMVMCPALQYNSVWGAIHEYAPILIFQGANTRTDGYISDE